jgi:uncharacterized protein involved in outer membrane biogenesis
LGAATLKDISMKLALSGGRLMLAPLKATLGGGTINGQINVAGASPAKVGVTITASGVNLADMLEMWGAEAFLSGKVDADMNIVATGDSMHALASSTSGTFNIVGAGGDLGGTGGNESVNCLVARFTAASGVVKDNGVLVDTGATTLVGNGGADLRSETIDFTMRAKTKGVNVGGLLPPLHVGGTLADPSFGMNGQAVLQNVAGLLTTGQLNDGVPTVMTQQGQNACIYTLAHPTAASAAPSQGGAVQNLAGKASQQLNKISGGALKGLLGQ